LSAVLHPEWHPTDRVVHHARHFRAALERGAHFLAVSDSVRQELIQTFSLPPARITRTYNGVRPAFRPLPEVATRPRLAKLGLPDNYLLYVGTVEPRKNLLTLVRSYCELPAVVRDRCPLVLAGAWGWGCGPVARYYHDEARHRGVIALSYVPEADLPALYNGARALVYPSFYEGFGLPPAEMLACGGAVLASTAEALAETIGPRAHLTDPNDAEGWRTAMGRAITDDGWLSDLRRGASAFAARYTWERCAADTWQVLRHLGGTVEEVGRRAA
jgi:alpha-1,3-rhamnosyl/mannosyltransferase